MLKLRIGRPLQGNFSDLQWTAIRAFDAHQLALSLVVGSLLGICCAGAWLVLDARSLPLGGPSTAGALWVVAALSVGHEFSHSLAFPGGGFDSKTVIGIWPGLAAPYAQYLAPMGRNRFMLVCLLPLATLSMFPLFLVAMGIGSVPLLSWISVLNCVFAGSDLFIFGKLFATVPASASILESEGALYWSHQ